MEQSYSRDQVAVWAQVTRPQLNHMCKLGLVNSDIGEVRKRISFREAQLAAGAAAFMRLGMQPKNLIAPFDWLRVQLETDEKCQERWRLAINSLPDAKTALDKAAAKFAITDFWLSIFADENEWRAHWSNAGLPIKGKEGSVLVNFKTVFANCGDIGKAS